MTFARQYGSQVALLLSVPCMSLAVAIALLAAPGMVGQSALAICQIWLLALPIVWQVWVRRGSLKVTPPKPSDWRMGVVLGLLMFTVILVGYGTILRNWIDAVYIREVFQQVGSLNQLTFLLWGAYLILVNALFEEYFWRWFVYSRCEEWVGSNPAVALSAFFFTLHHTLGLAVFTNWRTTLVGSLAVFAAGAIWCENYRRTRSVWGGYISHAIAVIALNIVAWQVFFVR